MPEPILIGEREYRKGEAVFANHEQFRFILVPPDEAGMAEGVRREKARAIVAGMHPFTGPLYEALHEVAGERGSLIARFGVGHDNIDKALAAAHGCLIANTPGVLDVSVAEHTLWLIGAIARHLAAADASLRGGEWASTPGIELRGKRLGIIGFGRIAQRVAAIAHFGFGMSVHACGTSSPAEWFQRHGKPLHDVLAASGVEWYINEPEPILAESDFVSLHLPASPANRHFINAERLRSMHSTAVLVNTARGSVLDEAALYDALAAGRIAGAALDVFEREPYEPVAPDKDLRTLKNVVLTPHIASNTAEGNRRIAEKCEANLRHFLRGETDAISLVH
jgi:lactate dehydrogenase-like 2-hydroxyacid dehydrogenase